MTRYGTNEKAPRRDSLPETKVQIESTKGRRHTHGPMGVQSALQNYDVKAPLPSKGYAYDNPAYVGSRNSVSQVPSVIPPTGVVREQYWACTRWPKAQKLLALMVGILLGTVMGLAITLGLRKAGADTPMGDLIRTH